MARADIGTVAINLLEENQRLRSLIAEAVKVLEPFGREATMWPPGLVDGHEPFLISRLQLGDFRAACALTERLKAALPE